MVYEFFLRPDDAPWPKSLTDLLSLAYERNYTMISSLRSSANCADAPRSRSSRSLASLRGSLWHRFSRSRDISPLTKVGCC